MFSRRGVPDVRARRNVGGSACDSEACHAGSASERKTGLEPVPSAWKANVLPITPHPLGGLFATTPDLHFNRGFGEDTTILKRGTPQFGIALPSCGNRVCRY